jgi:colanic acid biosynthesis glycosyl transferase WcaI
MRIGFVTQWFPPEPGTAVASAIARGLAGRGHQVDVLTGFPNYPTGVLHPDYPLRPYRRDDLGDGIVVHRAPLFPSHDAHAMRRMANYASFATAATAVGRLRVPKPDAWLVYSSPATAALPALLGRGGRATPTFLIVQDLWPDSVTDSGMLGGRSREFVDTVLGRFCDWTYRRSTGIGVISPGMRGVLASRGVPQHRIFDTPNWIDPAPPSPETPEAARRRLGLAEGRIFLYAGNLGEMQDLGPLVGAFEQVPDAHLVLLGDGVARPRLVELVSTLGLSNVTFVGSVPSEAVAGYVTASDVQVVSLQDTPLLRVTMPSKVQASLASGKPILAHVAGDVAELVDRHHAGLTARPGDLAGTVAAIRSLTSSSEPELARMGAAGRRLYDEQFSAEVALDRLEAMLHSHLSPRKVA